MATKKKKNEALTKLQLKELVKDLLGSAINVYVYCKRWFDKQVGQEIFEQLWKAGIFRCEECSNWLERNELRLLSSPTNKEMPDCPLVCLECEDDENNNEDNDEDA